MLHPFQPLVYTAEAIAEFGEPTRLSSDRSPGFDNPISVNALHAGYEEGSYLRGEHRCRAMLDRHIMVEEPLGYVGYRIERPLFPALDGVVGLLGLDDASIHLHEGVMASAVAARSADIERAGAFLEPVIVATGAEALPRPRWAETLMRTVTYGDEVHSIRSFMASGVDSGNILPESTPEADNAAGYVVIDGHHRIVAARQHAQINGIAPSILAMVVDIDSPGLVVVPQHRVLGGSPIDLDLISDNMVTSPYTPGDTVPPGAVAIVGREVSVLVSKSRDGDSVPEDRISSVTLAEHLLDPLGLWVQGFATREADVYAELTSGASAVAIMGDLDIEDIVATATKGIILPEKTTCFSPKVAVGLVGVTA